MRLVTFSVSSPIGHIERLGAVVSGDPDQDAQIADLNLAFASFRQERGEDASEEAVATLMPSSMLEFLEGGRAGMERAEQTIEFLLANPGTTGVAGQQLVFRRSEVRLLAPLPRPRSIRDFSTYEAHMSRRGTPKPPQFYHFAGAYKGNPAAVRGPEDDMLYPAYTGFMDPELELGAVVGKRGRNIPVDQASSYIAGYTMFIDCSARDLVGNRDWLGQFKAKDFCTMLGPVLVTPDEFDEAKGKCSIRVNGETWWEGDLGDARHYYTPELIAYASEGEEIQPGDLIGSGTVGTGCSMDIGRWVQPGDQVEHWIEGIGTMRSTVVREELPLTPSHVRDGLPGHLDVPPHAREYLVDVRAMENRVREGGHPWAASQ